MSDALKITHARIANALGDLAPLFKPGCKLTFIMRNPADEESYILIGDDNDPEKIIETIRRSVSAELRTLSPDEVLANALGLEMPK